MSLLREVRESFSLEEICELTLVAKIQISGSVAGKTFLADGMVCRIS